MFSSWKPNYVRPNSNNQANSTLVKKNKLKKKTKKKKIPNTKRNHYNKFKRSKSVK